jgi:hypothetical protein
LAGDVPGVCGSGARLSGGHVLQHLPLDAGPPPHRFVTFVPERLVIKSGSCGQYIRQLSCAEIREISNPYSIQSLSNLQSVWS